MNVLSFLDTVTVLSDDLSDWKSLPTSLLPEVDFESLIDEVLTTANETIAVVDQVVESTTELVLNTLNTDNAEIDTADISGIVQDIVNFIVDLPDNVTIIDVLNDISVPALSDEQLLELLTNVSDLINAVAPDLSQLSIKPALDQGVEFVGDLVDSVGTITLEGANLSGELTLDGATRSFTTDLSDDIDGLVADVSNFLSRITGSASLSGGEFIGDITIDGVQYELSLDITQALTDTLTSLLVTTQATLPFTNGAIAVDIKTALGDIDGTVDFAGGDLALNLTTPFGNVDTSIEFPENAQFNFPVEWAGLSPLDLELDLAAGVLSIPINGTQIDLALETFSGELVLDNGTAELMLDLGWPDPIEIPVELGPLASQIAVELTEDFNGALTINAGDIDGVITTRFGEFVLSESLNNLMLQASSVINETTGLLTLNEGLAALSFNTPFGVLSGGLALSPIEDALTVDFGLLV
ncbi:MAG: hypothetical protein F6K31_20865 [Symploca sp. SIO2G7]|nr:hypothetical protein [Symploca sp. SIO2G7]